MTEIFKIIGLSLDITWKNKTANFSAVEDRLAGQSADLFLLPEMFSTGFIMDPQGFADEGEETLSWMKAFSKQKNAAVAGSAAVKCEGKFYNRFYSVTPDGNFHTYDKRHLFSYSGEDLTYTKGEKRVIFSYKGVRFLPQICYDLRFPVFSRNDNDYDVALYVANWPAKRQGAWEHLLKARAIENQAVVFGLNRTGSDGNGLEYAESSHCFFASGADISAKSGLLISAEIDLQKLREFRSHFQFLKDRDAFSLDL